MTESTKPVKLIKARSRYTRWGDRSPEARAANAAYMRDLRARKRAASEVAR